MKKIILEGDNREINITSKDEVHDIHGVVNELIIPSFHAFGFDRETILDGLQSYFDEHRPIEHEPQACHAAGCRNEAHNHFCADHLTEIVDHHKELGQEIQELTEAKEELGNLVMKLRKELEEAKKPFEHKHQHGEAPVVIRTLDELYPEQEELFECNECETKYPADDMVGDLCRGCDDYRTTCPCCGGHTENDYSDCISCEEEAEREYEREMEELGENEGDCIQTQPSSPDVWSTGEVPQDVWSTNTPIEQPRMEPEQANVPKLPFCFRCGEYQYQEVGIHSDIHGEYQCPQCGHIIYKKDIGASGHRPLARLKEAEERIANLKEIPPPADDEWECPECGWYNVSEIDKHCAMCGYDPQGWLKKLYFTDYAMKEPSEIKVEPEPQPAQPAPESVSVWTIKDLEESLPDPEPAPRQETDMDCISCGTNMDEDPRNRGEYVCPNCEYSTGCECYDCRKKRDAFANGRIEPPIQVKKPVPKPRPAPKRNRDILPASEQEENYLRNKLAQIEIQKKFDSGNWKPSDNSGNAKVSCRNAKRRFDGINCSDNCGDCPVGSKNQDHGFRFNLFYCPKCNNFFEKPFPLGCCPSCGIHGHEGGNQPEFCSTHWDIHRARDGFEAGADENWKDDDDEDEICGGCGFLHSDCHC